jgi:hypothetical protein
VIGGLKTIIRTGETYHFDVTAERCHLVYKKPSLL